MARRTKNRSRFDKRSDSERRIALANIYGLGVRASWNDIDEIALASGKSTDAYVMALGSDVTRRKLSTPELRRIAMAKQFGLKPDADWDDVYRAWKRRWGYGSAALKILAISAVPVVIILLISTHWFAIVFAMLAFVSIGFLSFFAYGFGLEDQYHGVIFSNPEIGERAKRDGIFH